MRSFDAGFNSVIESVEPLARLGDSPVQFGEMFTAALGALLAAVENASKDALQPLGLKQPVLKMVGDQIVEPVPW